MFQISGPMSCTESGMFSIGWALIHEARRSHPTHYSTRRSRLGRRSGSDLSLSKFGVGSEKKSKMWYLVISLTISSCVAPPTYGPPQITSFTSLHLISISTYQSPLLLQELTVSNHIFCYSALARKRDISE